MPLNLHPISESVTGRAKSRSPSLAPSEIPSLMDAAPSRERSVSREFTRARSGSILLADDVTARAKVSRGGVATSHSMFARQVDMRKSAQPDAGVSKGKQKAKGKVNNDSGPSFIVPSKRMFSRAITVPLKPQAIQPVTLVAATPASNRTRAVSMEMDLQESPDSLRLSSPEYEGKREMSRLVLVPDTPMKS